MANTFSESALGTDRGAGPSMLALAVAALSFVGVALTLPSAVSGPHPVPLWVVGPTTLPFLALPLRRAAGAWSRFGGIYAAVWIGLLMAATGGVHSPYVYLYAILIILSSIWVSRLHLAVIGVLAVAGAASPFLYDPGADWPYLQDVLFNSTFVLVTAFTIQQILRRLSTREEHFRLLAENAQDVVYRIRLAPRPGFDYVSPSVERATGITPDELYAQPGLSLEAVHEDDRPRMATLVSDPPAEPLAVTARIRHRDGRVRWVEHRLSTVRDDDGIPVAIEGIFRDVTNRVEAEHRVAASEAQFRSMAQRASDVIYRVRVRPSLRFEFINDVAETVSGYPAQRFLDEPSLVWERMDPEDRERHRELRRDTARLEEPIVVRWQRADGAWVWLEERLTPVLGADGETEVVHGIVRDVSSQKEAEDRLRAALDHERTAADRLRALDELKNAFLQAVSHELRTPLTSLVGYAQTLEMHDGALTREQRSTMLERINVNASKLQRMLTDLLDVDRLARGQMVADRAPTDLTQLVCRVVADTDVQGRHVDLLVDQVTARVDAAKVERIVENLVSNAVKHTPPGTPLTVRLGTADGVPHLVVEDHGPGIPDDLKGEIFEPFRQGPQSVTAASPGTGIGLSLVARLATLHGGRAWVDDGPGGGARFHVLLPDVAPDEVDAGLERSSQGA